MAGYVPRFPGDCSAGFTRLGSSAASGPHVDRYQTAGERDYWVSSGEGGLDTRFGARNAFDRIYYSGVPSGATVKAAAQAAINAGRLPWISFKMTPWTTQNQSQMDEILNSLWEVYWPSGHPLYGGGTVPADVWLTHMHEPENDTPAQGTPAQFASQQEWMRTRIEARRSANGGSNVAFGPVWMHWVLFDAGGSGSSGARGRVINMTPGSNYTQGTHPTKPAGGEYNATTNATGWFHVEADKWLPANGTWDFVGADIYDLGRNGSDHTPKGFLDVDEGIPAGTGGRLVGYGNLTGMSGTARNYAWSNFLAWCEHKVVPYWNVSGNAGAVGGADNTPGAPFAVGEFANHHTQAGLTTTPEYGGGNADQTDALQAEAIRDFWNEILSWPSTVGHRCVGAVWWDESVANSQSEEAGQGLWAFQSADMRNGAGAGTFPTNTIGSSVTGHPRADDGLLQWKAMIADSRNLEPGFYGDDATPVLPSQRVARYDGQTWVEHEVLRRAGGVWSVQEMMRESSTLLPGGYDSGTYNSGNYNEDV